MTKNMNQTLFYSSIHNNNNNNNNNNNGNDDRIFSDEHIQRYDADTIRRRYGDNWRKYASNIRETKQADGSIMREYIIDDPSLIKDIKHPSDNRIDFDTEQPSTRNKFAQIKAKFEQKSIANIMASPSSPSSATSSNTTTTATRTNLNTETNYDSYTGESRRSSYETLSASRKHFPISNTQANAFESQHSRSTSTSNSTFRRLNSAEEADEEVQQIHRQVKGYPYQHETLNTTSSTGTSAQQPSNVQYEIMDDEGNPMVIEGVQDLIKNSGATAREIKQPDGSVIREYVIDDPEILSRYHSQKSPSFVQQHANNKNNITNIPPPPPRIPMKQPSLFPHGHSTNDNIRPINIQQVRVLEPQRRYEYITTSGKRIEFMITNSDTHDDSDVNELATAINSRLIPSKMPSPGFNASQSQFTLPKPWRPAVDFTQRELPARERVGSDSQSVGNNYQIGFQQPTTLNPDLARSSSYGALSQTPYQQQFGPIFTEPIIDWSALRQQDPHGQIDQQLIQQFIQQKYQNEPLQSSAQFLPEQQKVMTRSTHSPSQNNQSNYYHQQSMPYPYQGQQQHGVRVLNADYNNVDFNQQQATMFPNGHTRI